MITRFLGRGFLPAVYLLMLLVIFILPFFSVPEYSILKNTTSHLGAQGAPNAWVMNAVFGLQGLAAIADGWQRFSGLWFQMVILVVFGVSLFATAFFQHAPIVRGVEFSVAEDDLHSKLATVTGFSFVIFAVSAAFIEPTKKRQVLAAATGLAAMVLSMLIFNVTELAGVWQRIIFVAMFAWLIYFLNTQRRTRSRLHAKTNSTK